MDATRPVPDWEMIAKDLLEECRIVSEKLNMINPPDYLRRFHNAYVRNAQLAQVGHEVTVYVVRYDERERGWGGDTWTRDFSSLELAQAAVTECNSKLPVGHVPDYYVKAEYIGSKQVVKTNDN